MESIEKKLNYKLNSISSAVNLFSQILSIEQMCKYGFEFVVDILKLEEAGLYILHEGLHVLENKTEAGNFKKSEINTEKTDKIATLHGRTLTKDFSSYFSKEFCENSNLEFVMPIIAENKVWGFIVANKTKDNHKEYVDIDFIELIRNIFTMSVYIAINKKNDLRFKKENDRNMFNLSFVNQSTKALFSELRLDKLYQLCIDMIRELTSSSVTSFSLYDEGSSKFVLKGYKDIINFNNYYIEFTIKDLSKDIEKSVFNAEEDMAILREIFEDTSVFEKLSAKYIVLLKKEKIIGVVTLGKPLSGEEYDLKTLEQVESLSTSIYISIMNALYIEEISMQKEKIESQLDSIGRLNRTIKNINSCESLEEMLEVCSDTLRFSYGVNKGAIIVRDSDNRFKLANGIGFDYFNDKYINEASKILKIDEFYFSFEYSKANKYIKDFIDDVDFNGSRNCLVISPIRLDIFEKNSEGIFGYIVIWDTISMIKSNDLVSIETLTNSMAPIVRQFLLQNQKMEILSEDSRKIFKKRIDELNLSSSSYRIYYKFIHCELFEDVDLALYSDVDHYYFSSMLLCTAYKDEEIDDFLFDGYVEGGQASLETLSSLHKEYMKKLEGK